MRVIKYPGRNWTAGALVRNLQDQKKNKEKVGTVLTGLKSNG